MLFLAGRIFMPNVIFKNNPELYEKSLLMGEDARFEVSDNDSACVPDLTFITDEIRSKAPLPKVPKLFYSNDCIFNCAYCGCRESNECKSKYNSPPAELASLAVRQAKNGHGIFISSAISKNPDYTQENLIETARIIRRDLGYRGYLHLKVMPGASPELIRESGRYADRLSVNLEVAKSEGYSQIAKNKNKKNILTPMAQISRMIAAAKEEKSSLAPKFAVSQTTQIMAGSTGENDFTILNLSSALYEKYRLKRVYYTPFQYSGHAFGYEGLPAVSTPAQRMHRLYQADRMMQLYGFNAGEIAPAEAPDLSLEIDPKAAWALRNLHLFPIEINTAEPEQLLRIPGIGIIYSKRIIKARKYCSITHEILVKLGVSLKKSRHFITCDGQYKGKAFDNAESLRELISDNNRAQNGQITFESINAVI